MKYLSINAHTIRRNAKHGSDEPPIRIARSPSDKAPLYAREVVIKGDSRLVYSPDEPMLSCGARLALVCDDVEIIR